MKNLILKIFRKKHHQKINLCEEKYNHILKSLNAISYQINIQNPNFIYMEGCVEELTGYKPEDFITGKQFWFHIIHEDDLKNVIKESNKLITNNNYIADNEYRIINKNGEIKWVRDIANSKVVNGKKFIMGLLYDITKQKEKDEELLFIKQSIENARLPIFWINAKGEILYVNKSACEKLEYKKDELLKMTVFDIDKSIKKDKWETHWQKTLDKNSYTFQTIHTTKSGKEIPVEVFVDTYKFKDKFIHTDFVLDISERIAHEKELLDAKEKAEISDRLKSAFLSQMSHEIRTPLQKILGFVSLIRDYLESSLNYVDKEIEDYFTSINLSSKRLIRTIDTILNMSEMQLNSYTPVFIERDLYPLILDLYNDFKHEAELKKLKFDLVALTEFTKVKIDEYSTIQIFENLIDNAIKYTDAGEVKIIVGRNNNNTLFVEISDTGIGMSEKYIERLFQPFNQEEIGYTRRYEGLGLGLALVKKYCDLNNATIDVSSKKGEGTSIRIIFPSSIPGINYSNDSLRRVELNRF
ncbi:sensor histidine kinase [Rosettibacter firmus]|uniref:sensor histidine kinase n=1 Tax=Rosettibacter firmus TaxID=3111522 RepID=UPI00336BC0BF